MNTVQSSAIAIALTLILLICTASAAKIDSGAKDSAVELDSSNEQQVALHLFREYIKDVPLEDYQLKDSHLTKWLKANEWNPFFAAQKIDEAQQWREDNNIDTILDEQIPTFPGYVVSKTSMDFWGHPVLTKSLKAIDLKKLIGAGKKDIYFRYNFQILEQMAERARIISNLTGTEITQIYSIVDFNGFNKKQHACKDCLETMVEYYKDALKYYPGLKFREVWINTPKIATPLVKAVRALYAKTNEDLKIFGTDRTEWSQFLHKDIPSDQLTVQFGGTQFGSTLLTAI